VSSVLPASRPALEVDGDQQESVARDRLQPVLLDRLTDKQPQSRQERAGAFLMSGKLLRDSVLRDLQWLLNTTNFGAGHTINAMPRARRSVVNYGVRGWAGGRMSEVDFADVEAAIRRHGGPLLRGVTLFDIYRGKPLADGDKSLAYRLHIRDDDRTLTEAELDEVVAAVISGIAADVGARFRT